MSKLLQTSLFSKFVLQNWQAYSLLALGTLIRGLYGIYSKAWLEAPDQLAWGLTLDEMAKNSELSYKQLMYYPHEGGGFLIAVLALCLRPLENLLPALSIAALLIDTLGRFIQFFIAKRLFGNVTASWFALWSLLSVPLLISWASVNFCLHHLSSFLPFVFVYYVTKQNSKFPNSVACGIVTGLSISFSYNNIIFIPAYLIWLFLNPDTSKIKIWNVTKYSFFALLALLPHLFLRLIPDNGFHLEKLSLSNIREFSPSDIASFEGLKHLLTVGLKPFPSSFFLAAGGPIFSTIQILIVIAFCGYGIFRIYKNREYAKNTIRFPIMLILIFIVFYALGPFYSDSSGSKSYYYYRHLSYILPLLMIVLIDSLVNSGRKEILILLVWIFVCAVFTIQYMFTNPPAKKGLYKIEGWILARKFGENPTKLMQLSQTAPVIQRKELTFGFGWGISAALFRGKTIEDKASIKRFIEIYSRFPEDKKNLILEGTRFAFNPAITPKLDIRLLTAIYENIAEKNE